MDEYVKIKKKTTIPIRMVATAVLFSLCSVLLLGCDALSGLGRNVPSVAQITSISYVQDLQYNGVPFLSISPDGEYAIIVNKEEMYIQILQNNNGSYEQYKNLYMPDSVPEEVANRTIGSVTDSDIAWSNSGDKFAFSMGTTEYFGTYQSCIFTGNINSGSITQLTGQEIDWDTGILSRGFIVDYLSAWSDNDRTIYFVRLGDLADARVTQLCSIPAGGGSVKVEHSVGPFLKILNLFSRGDALYYSITGSFTGIFMFQNGRETHLVDADVYYKPTDSIENTFPWLLDVSADGSTIVYYRDLRNMISAMAPDLEGQHPHANFMTEFGSTIH